MLKLAETLPVKTRLPHAAWALAGLLTLYSMVSSLVVDVQAVSDRAIRSAEQPK
ncbi:MAG: hypothetical protein ACLQF1_06640 [Methyloceanibacter sp.]|jgi:hypothetical protein